MLNAGDILKYKDKRLVSVGIESTVAEALNIMLENKIGAILVKDGEEIKGIWTERDLMKNVVTDGFHSKTTKIKDVMTTNLISAPDTDDLYHLMDKCLGERLRHLLIKKDGKYVGILSAGDITRAHLMKKSSELEELNKMANWDYYEDWKFNKK